MKNVTIVLPCEPGDIIHIKARDIEAMVIRIEITKIGIRIFAKHKEDVWEFWDCQSGKDFIVKES